MKYLYGNSWEKYPVVDRSVWCDSKTNSKIINCNFLLEKIPSELLSGVDLIYVDPPWQLNNYNCFITKAEKTNYIMDFNVFVNSLFSLILNVSPEVVFIEIGKKHLYDFLRSLNGINVYTYIDVWKITYYKKHPCYLIRGSKSKSNSFDYSGKDDAYTPELVIKNENPKYVFDPCTGQGLTAVAAMRNQVRFLGTDLNKRRLAVAIDRCNFVGGEYRNVGSIS